MESSGRENELCIDDVLGVLRNVGILKLDFNFAFLAEGEGKQEVCSNFIVARNSLLLARSFFLSQVIFQIEIRLIYYTLEWAKSCTWTLNSILFHL